MVRWPSSFLTEWLESHSGGRLWLPTFLPTNQPWDRAHPWHDSPQKCGSCSRFVVLSLFTRDLAKQPGPWVVAQRWILLFFTQPQQTPRFYLLKSESDSTFLWGSWWSSNALANTGSRRLASQEPRFEWGPVWLFEAAGHLWAADLTCLELLVRRERRKQGRDLLAPVVYSASLAN